MAGIGRNEPCWCGSGKKYKRCHLDRERERPVAPPELAQQFHRYFQVKTCLHPLAGSEPCGKVIAAHTIQARGPIAGIVDESGHCLTFYPAHFLREREPQNRGWREASTFYGFCQLHDGPTFAPIEAQQFVGLWSANMTSAR